MNTRLLLFICTLVVLFTGSVFATNYYVADPSNSNPTAAWGGTPSDNNNGRSWASAFATINHAQTVQQRYDTFFISTGIWYDQQWACSSNVVWACSSFADTNANGEYHFAKIWGNAPLTDWVQYSGDIYRYNSAFPYEPGGLFQSDTSAFLKSTSLAGLPEGHWYWNGGNTLFIHIFGGGDPDTATAIVEPGYFGNLGAPNADVANNGLDYAADSVTFWGLEFKYAHGRFFTLHNYNDYVLGGTDIDGNNAIEFNRCKFSMAVGCEGSNPALLGSGDNVNNILVDNVIRACSLSGVWAYYYSGGTCPNTSFGGGHKGNGIVEYVQKGQIIDSNTFYGYFQGAAIQYKSDDNGFTVPNQDSCVNAFNHYDQHHGSAMFIFGHTSNLFVYGNIFRGGNGSDKFMEYYGSRTHTNNQPYYITNNTIYGTSSVIQFTNKEGISTNLTSTPTDCIFKYNVIYNNGSMTCTFSTPDIYIPWAEIDSNLYYHTGTPTWQADTDGPTSSWSTWQGYGWDAASSNSTDPGFADAANSDFRRLGATQEMDTVYGGTHWQVFGALQAGASPPPPDTDPPIISGVAANSVTQASANIIWTTNEPATSQVQYGTTTSYGTTTPLVSTLTTGHTVQLSNLNSSTLYHYRVISTDASGNTRTGNDNTFSTTAPPPPDITPPVISNVAATGVNASTATIVWSTDEPANSRVEYGLTTSYGQSTILNSSYSTGHSEGLTGLDSSKTYHYRVISADSAGNSATSNDFTFTTLSQTQNNIAVGAAVVVSGTYSGYSPAVLTDGIYNPRSTSATWASDESSTATHWVEIDLGAVQSVNSLTINWAWNSVRTSWMTSQQYSVQYWNGSSWTDLHYQSNSTADSATSTAFAQVNAQRFRVYQPANMGPSNYTTIMWIAEIEIFGGAANGDITPPAAVNDLGWVPQDDDLSLMILGWNDNAVVRYYKTALSIDRRGNSDLKT